MLAAVMLTMIGKGVKDRRSVEGGRGLKGGRGLEN